MQLISWLDRWITDQLQCLAFFFMHALRSISPVGLADRLVTLSAATLLLPLPPMNPASPLSQTTTTSTRGFFAILLRAWTPSIASHSTSVSQDVRTSDKRSIWSCQEGDHLCNFFRQTRPTQSRKLYYPPGATCRFYLRLTSKS